MHRLIIATRNPHKTREFAQLIGADFEVRDLSDAPDLPAVEETGATFKENAILKAVAASRYLSDEVVADDSGLEVDALAGAPGIYSARYAGEHASDAANMAKVLTDLAALGPDKVFHSARFRCCLALAREGEVWKTFEGAVEGTIVAAPRGSNGFGYDPIFQPEGFAKTFAQLSSEEKNRIS
ncbi:MAG TPA: RdgB/HAM1 family non-canonical purine NTP pyrophosphatase, partial [Chthoniobacterales bacterium]